jgi:hypothetical protein
LSNRSSRSRRRSPQPGSPHRAAPADIHKSSRRASTSRPHEAANVYLTQGEVVPLPGNACRNPC